MQIRASSASPALSQPCAAIVTMIVIEAAQLAVKRRQSCQVISTFPLHVLDFLSFPPFESVF